MRGLAGLGRPKSAKLAPAAGTGGRPRLQHVFIYDPVDGERVRPGSELKLEFLSPVPRDAKAQLDVQCGDSTRRYEIDLGDTVRLPNSIPLGEVRLQIKLIAAERILTSQWLRVLINPDADPNAFETGERIYCHRPWTQMNIGKANASPCCNFTRKFRNPYRDDAEGYDPWNSKTMQTVRAALVRGCTKYCFSGCRNLEVKDPERGWPSNRRADIREETGQRAENFDAARRAFIRGDTVLRHSPLVIKLTVNHFCNHACLFCARDIRSGWKANDAIFAILRRHLGGISRLGMTGGEPLVFLDEVKGRLSELESELRGVIFGITTNASLIPRSIDFLSAIERLFMYVSLNAGTRETYRLVHRKDHFDKVIDGTRQLQQRRVGKHLHIRLKMVIMRQNQNDIPAYVELAKNLGVDAVKFVPALLYNNADMTADDQIRSDMPEWHHIERQLQQAQYDLSGVGIRTYCTKPGRKREDGPVEIDFSDV